jgi:CRP-like cAMP-binding protein
MPIRAFIAGNPDELEKICRFRYRVYVEELGFDPPDADHSRKLLRDAADDYSISYGLIDEDGNVLGSLRATRLSQSPDPSPYIEKYHMEPAIAAFGLSSLVASGRFMLDPKLRHGLSLQLMVRMAYEDGRRDGVRLIYLDCSPHLIRFYEGLGCRRYTAGFDDTFYGFKLPILLPLGDREHFAAVRSPLAPLAAAYPDDTRVREWFAETYPEWVRPRSAGLLSPTAFFDLLAERIASDPTHAIALFHGLSREETQDFLRAATVISVDTGDRIVHEGQHDSTVYVLLKGLAEVVRGERGQHVVATLGAGDTFGEIGFLVETPRTATVVARTPCEVLTLTADFLHRFLADHAVVAARLLYNLSRILAVRLARTTLGHPEAEPVAAEPYHAVV